MRDIDHGAEALIRRMASASVRVGVIGSKADNAHQGSALTVADVATFHEFGLGVPPRSFIADYVDEDESSIKVRIEKIPPAVVKGADLTQQLDRLGLWLTGQMKLRIRAGIEPPLSPATIRRKGSSKPLIDTGQLWSSITHEVVDG